MRTASLPARRPLRVLMASPVFDPCIGGGERLLQVVAEQLAARGHSVTVVTLNAARQPDLFTESGAGLPREQTINRVRVRRVNPGGGRLGRGMRWWLRQRGGWRSTHWALGSDASWMLGPPYSIAMLPALLTLPADVIVSANWVFSSSRVADIASRIRRRPLIGLPLFHIARPWADDLRYRPMLAQARSMIALTEAERDFMRVRGAREVRVVGCGVDPSRFSQPVPEVVRRRHGLGDQPVVGFVGRQDRLKGVPTLIEAMKRVWREVPHAVLLLAGQSAHRDRSTEEHLAHLAPDERGRVVLADDFAHADAPSLFAACDLVVLPSVEEAFGLVFLEAWMVRRPVVGVRIPSTECVITEGADGLIARPEDPADLAACIIRLLRNPEERRVLGERGYQKVMAHYTLDRIVEQWEQILFEAVSGPPSDPLHRPAGWHRPSSSPLESGPGSPDIGGRPEHSP